MKSNDIFRQGIKRETVSTKLVTVDYVGKKGQKVLLYTQYGSFMNFPDNGLVGLLADQGNEESLLALPTDIENREALENNEPLEEGEIAFGIPNKFARIYFRNDNSVVANNEKGSISLLEDGTSEIKNEKGSVVLDAKGTITASNESGSITLNSDGTITINSTKDINITGTANINVEASSNTTIKATGLLTLESGDATPWQPNIIPACLFTGAPHGGVSGGIVKLKGA